MFIFNFIDNNYFRKYKMNINRSLCLLRMGFFISNKFIIFEFVIFFRYDE